MVSVVAKKICMRSHNGPEKFDKYKLEPGLTRKAQPAGTEFAKNLWRGQTFVCVSMTSLCSLNRSRDTFCNLCILVTMAQVATLMVVVGAST